ncbi:MAG: alpha/beta hydrolase [Hyphomicrobiales bacterium]|nr:alpha/beta hydrolase [Hyphomicrobiales bacterium]MBV9975493.1 alpha/beta hydrolase [Hyphomicrobiales bacterium]
MHLPVALSLTLVILVALWAFSLASTININRRYPPEGRFHALEGANSRRNRIHLFMREPRIRSASADVVLIHGAFASMGDQLLALAETLCERFRVIAVDRPGQGWSDRSHDTHDASPARQAALIYEALRAQGVERAIVIGHSFGAAVAAALALEHPSFVRGVVFVAPATHPWPGGIAWHYRIPALPLFGRIFTELFAPVLGPLLLRPGIREVFRPQTPPRDYAQLAGAARALTPSRLRANGQDVAGLKGHLMALSPRYREIKAPCVIVTGDADSTVSPEIHSRALAREIKGASLVVLAGVGHMPHHARPDAILAAVEEIVART